MEVQFFHVTNDRLHRFHKLQPGYSQVTQVSQVTARLHVKLAQQVMGDRLYVLQSV